jgi:cytochrome c-type biogenesis protein CcmE
MDVNRTRAKIFVAGTVLAVAVAYLGFAGVKSGWVYMVDVEQYLADSQFAKQRVRVHGVVAAEGLISSPARLTASFRLQGRNGGAIPVVYHGNIPEMFGPDKNVVVEGRRDPQGVFQADLLMTKCASKYEPGSPHQTEHAEGAR